MKKISPPPVKVPRLNSLLHRLQKNHGPDDEPYLDQLMLFLDDPPKGVTNRWKAGAEMCDAWGIATTDTSVWRLFTSHLIEWRVRVALKIDGAEIEPQVLAEKITHMISLRTCEMLGNPATPPAALVGLMRLNLRHKYYGLAWQKQRFHEMTATERALAELKIRSGHDHYAQFAFKELTEALDKKPSKWRDFINKPFHEAYKKAFGCSPDDSPSSVDSVISEQPTPKTP